MFHTDKAFQIQQMHYEEVATKTAQRHAASERQEGVGERLFRKARAITGLNLFSVRIL